MMVWFRPHRGLLVDSMREAVLFPNKEEMISYICALWGKMNLRPEDLVIEENRGKDPRIAWSETRYVCAKRLGDTVYDVPQCIGMCSFEEGEFVKKKRVVTVTFEFEPGPTYIDGELDCTPDYEYARHSVRQMLGYSGFEFVKADMDGFALEGIV